MINLIKAYKAYKLLNLFGVDLFHLVRDARRYRYIRKQADGVSVNGDPLTPEQFDDQVDVCMLAEDFKDA